ncbi:MAG: malate synthase A, partial [Flavobacteriaceae bacterium]|nr:malate synthase A [Flavobacteriaceae bacterium]
MEHKLLKSSKISFSKNVNNHYPEILTDEALRFLTKLHENFNAERLQLLSRRLDQQNLFDDGTFPKFPSETEDIREREWVAGNIPHDLQDRRVEITGPIDRKMIINALNSGAKTFMADLEDSNVPSWENTIQGQQNLKDATKKTISFIDLKKNKSYKLNPKTAVLLLRPRGLHLNER